MAEKYNIGKTQVASILKRKAEYLAAFEENRQGDRKRNCYSNECNIKDTAMWDWFQWTLSMNIPISAPMIQEKALEFAKSLGINEFKASNGWLCRFNLRHNLVCGKMSGYSSIHRIVN